MVSNATPRKNTMLRTAKQPEIQTTFDAPRREISAVLAGANQSLASFSWQACLVTTVLSLGICAFVASYSMSVRPSASDRWLLAAALLMPALFLPKVRPTLLLDYLLIIVVINRELRRLLDWGEGRYDTLPILSLLPLIISSLMLVTVIKNWHRFPIQVRRAAGFFIAALAYATVIGVSQYGLAAVYACAEYATPLIVLCFCIACRPTSKVLYRWLTVLTTLGVLAGIYGVIQWIIVPQWDAAWLMWSGMDNSMGIPKPFQMSIASTLESRGPAAMFFAMVTAILIAVPAFRRRGGLVLSAIPFTALLLTRARTGLVYLVLGLIASSIFSRGKAGIKTLLTLCVTIGIAAAWLNRQEGSTAIFERVATLTEVNEDGSAIERIDIANQGFTTVLRNPLGFGFGSGGNAVKMRTGEQFSVGDNGYLEILSTLGIPGAALYACGLFQIMRLAFKNKSMETWDEAATHLGLGMLVAIAPALVIGNCLTTAHASYIWIILSRQLSAGPGNATSRVRWPGNLRRAVA
jgi:putative inorganic carbon (HCO3(-)) transporter